MGRAREGNTWSAGEAMATLLRAGRAGFSPAHVRTRPGLPVAVLLSPTRSRLCFPEDVPFGDTGVHHLTRAFYCIGLR